MQCEKDNIPCSPTKTNKKARVSAVIKGEICLVKALKFCYKSNYSYWGLSLWDRHEDNCVIVIQMFLVDGNVFF